jgi:hypothetical protein
MAVLKINSGISELDSKHPVFPEENEEHDEITNYS